MQKIAIEGINGAGKTPTIQLLLEQLATLGLTADTYAPFHLVRQKIPEADLFPLWEDRPEQAVQLLLETIAEIEADALGRRLDVLVFDRHWVTTYVQSLSNPKIKQWWGDTFVPTVLITSPEDHLLRLSRRGYSEPWLQADTLASYRADYDTVYRCHPERFIGTFTVASSNQDLQPMAAHITRLITKGSNT